MSGKTIMNKPDFSEIFSFITKYTSPSVMLKKDTDTWRFHESYDLEVTDKTYEDPKDTALLLGMKIVFFNDEYCLLSVKPEFENNKLIKCLFDHTREFSNMKSKDEYLKKLCFQLSCLEKLLPSIMEPLPADMTLYFILDSLSEMFDCSCALYSHSETKYTFNSSVGDFDFNKTFSPERKLLSSEVIFRECCCYSRIIDENDRDYILFFHKNISWKKEEISILKSIISLFGKYREFLRERQNSEETMGMMSQLNFILDLIYNFSTKILSSKNFDELIINISDSIREIFQSEFSAIYFRIKGTDKFKIKSHSSVRKNLVFPKYLKYDNNLKTAIFIPEDDDCDECINDELIDKNYFIELTSEKDCFIILGKSVIGDYLSAKNIQILDNLIPLDIKRAFTLIENINEIEYQKEYTMSIVNDMNYLFDNLSEIWNLENNSEIKNTINSLISKNHGFNIENISLYDFPAEEKQNIIKYGSAENPFGYAEVSFKNVMDLKKSNIAKFTVKNALTAMENARVFKPEKNILNISEMVFDFLRVKYRMKGFDTVPNCFILENLENFNIDEIDKYGVGIFTDSKLYYATFLESDDLKYIISERNL